MSPASPRRSLPRTVWALGLVSLLMDSSSELVHALLPLYMTTVLGASMLEVGLIEGVAEGIAAITKVFSGTLSDWLGRRKLLVVLGYGLAALSKPLFPLANGIGLVAGARFMDRIGKGIRGAPRDALIADVVAPELRGAAYGLRQALDSVAAHLATPHGILLQQPAYSRYYLHLGEISSYPPGYKENAGIFCHTNPWIIIAEAKVGRGNCAYDYYLRINPSAREEISDVHKCEPYVYAQMIAGRDAPTHGEAKNSWLTGTAAWNYVAVTQWILGIRPTFDGLEIAPVMPSAWDAFDAIRMFRGVRYAIHVVRKGSGDEVRLEVDRKAVNGTVITPPPDGTREVRVVVSIGED